MPVIREAVIRRADLRSDEITASLPSGRGGAFDHQMQWALSFMTRQGQLELLGTDSYRLTPVGYDALATVATNAENGLPEVPQPGQSTKSSVTGFSEQAETWPMNDELQEQSGPLAPGPKLEDQIRHHFELAYQEQKKALIRRICAQSPAFFEHLVMDLLLAMGYAQREEEVAACLGRTGDGGVDGVLHEDELGLSRIYFQAKRYRPGVAVPISAVRDFAGSLEAHKANRGVFMTTSHFPKSAEKFAVSISKRIVLINGDRLASLMMRHKIGVKLCAVYEVKMIDEAYFSQDIRG